MSTVLCFIKTATKIQASNEAATVVVDLDLEHPVGKLFPPGKGMLFAKCRVTDRKIEVLNPCKPWKKETSHGQA